MIAFLNLKKKIEKDLKTPFVTALGACNPKTAR